MRVYRYSRWDGSQEEFSLDVDQVLDAMTDLMMEGLDAQEALEWMRQHGFEMAGMNMRVMGMEELLSQLRDEMDALRQQYRMDESMQEMEQRLEDILDREESAQREAHGYESARMNDFMQRRHAENGEQAARLSERIERFRDHPFEDEQAGEDFRDLLEELERMQALEEFLEEQGQSFQGPESADYETAQSIREQMQALQQMAQDLRQGNFQSITPEQLKELLGEDASQSFILLRDMEDRLREAGYLRENDPQLTPRAIRKIGAAALADIYNALRKGMVGDHDSPGRGVAIPRPDETRPWQFGDPMNLDVVRTVMNGVKRGGIRPGGGVDLEVADFEIQEMDYSTQTTTILLLDMSWSMSWAGRFPAAKRVALAMDQLIRTRFPRDHFHVVGFSTRAREIPIGELPEVCWDMGDPFTNLQEGLMVAETLIRKNPSAAPQILVITDGQPTAYFEPMPNGAKQLRVEWPMGFGGVSPHAVAETVNQVRRVTKMGVTINTFMLDDAPELVGFIERVTEINKGRAFYTHPNRLGSFLMVDYISRRKMKRS